MQHSSRRRNTWMWGHAKLPRSGGQLYIFLSVTHHAVLAEAKWGVLCQDCESKLCNQVAELEACIVQLQFSVIRTTKLAALAASLPPCPDSRASTVYPSCTCVQWGALPFCCGIISDFVSMPSPSPSHNVCWHPSSRLSSHSSILSIQIPDSHIKLHSHLSFNLDATPCSTHVCLNAMEKGDNSCHLINVVLYALFCMYFNGLWSHSILAIVYKLCRIECSWIWSNHIDNSLSFFPVWCDSI